MLRNEPLTAIVPVRGGSKGVPGKNLFCLCGTTLLERAIRLGLASNRVDRVLVTTDDPAMEAIAEQYAARARKRRPNQLATDTALTTDVVRHLVESEPVPDGFLLLLQATSPLRTLADLDAACALFEATPDAPALASIVSHSDPHPYKLQCIEGGRLKSFLSREAGVPRQELPPVYALNGAFYLIHRNTLLRENTFLPDGTLAFEMPPERSINVDTPMDLEILSALAETGRAVPEDLPANSLPEG